MGPPGMGPPPMQAAGPAGYMVDGDMISPPSPKMRAGRFKRIDEEKPDDDQVIWKHGCALKFAKHLDRAKKQIWYIVVMLCLPCLLNVYFVSKLLKFMKEQKELKKKEKYLAENQSTPVTTPRA